MSESQIQKQFDQTAAMPRLFLLDGMALIYRAHFALISSPRFTSGNLCTSAVFGITNTVFDILKSQQPTHLAMAIDTPEPTFRHEMFPAYKAQRDELPEDIASQIPLVNRLMDAMNIPVIGIPGHEADDIIGTLAEEAAAAGFLVWMVTPDKDFQQLVTDRISIYKPGRQGSTAEIIGVDDVLKNWGIQRVEQVVDVLALMGDASDNIPGIPGVGEKTAQKLISQFDSVDNLIANTHQLKGKQKENIEKHIAEAKLSKQLVTINKNVPHEFTLDALSVRPYDAEKLQKLFMELEFDTLGKRVFGTSFNSSQTRTAVIREKRERVIQKTLFSDSVEEKQLHQVKHKYHTITTITERQALLKKLLQQKSVCFDTETTSLDARSAEPLGVAFAFKPHEAYFVACPPDLEEARQVLNEFLPFFEHPTIEKVGHNLKYDLTLLKWQGIEVSGPLFDTMLAHSLKEPEMNHGMDYLAKLYLGYHPIPISALIGEKGSQISMRDVPLPQLAEYACEDADVTLQICEVLRKGLAKDGMEQVCFEIEFPLIPVLVDMEFQGIRLDAAAIKEFGTRLELEIKSLAGSIHEAGGRTFNIDSPKQLGEVLFDDLRLEANPKKTATGQYSTRESDLMRLASKHQIVRDIMEYRNATKLKSVYVDQLPQSVNPKTGRVHTHYLQTWTSTGRMQSNEPNLQTIPIRKQRGREIRAAFVPRNTDYQILSADYSQIELRIMAELSQDPGMLEAFYQGIDIHAATASKVFKVDLADVTREMRDKAKTVNFGIIYGISAFGLQQRLNIPRAEANDLIETYFEKHPAVRKYIDRTIEFAREKGYVVTRSGRRRYLRDINSRNNSLRNAAERLAMNSPLQGTAADMLKLAMVKVFNALRQNSLHTKMLLTVHDEIVFDMHRGEKNTVIPIIVECMKTAMPMQVPIEVEVGVGDNWLEAH
ncbi:MAG TPA: DNA polymerase I [Pirellulaceae bacterium]|nr:DNA polymerase I [Pirellulaceae bacterium]HMO93976.1 DNA polymerase I [Pirellulaceae bacterium]HMP70834.1 DNA polymerase I [Pirellulaceae bacterium]